MNLLKLLLGDNEPKTGSTAPLFGWVTAEVHAHDRTGCTGTDFVSGKWGGLTCTKCGK